MSENENVDMVKNVMVKPVDKSRKKTAETDDIQYNKDYRPVSNIYDKSEYKSSTQAEHLETIPNKQADSGSVPASTTQPQRETFLRTQPPIGVPPVGNCNTNPYQCTSDMVMVNDGKAPMNATVLIDKIIDSEIKSRYGCRVTIGRGVIDKEIPVSKYADGSWLRDIPGFVSYKDKRFITAYLNHTVNIFQGSVEYEVRKPGWMETPNGFVYVTPQGVIGYSPYVYKSICGQKFGRYENLKNVGLIKEFLCMESLTPNSPVATIICLYMVLSFNYSLFKKAKIPVKFLLFLHGKRATRKTSLVSAMTQLEHRTTALYSLRSTSAGLEAGFRDYKDAVMLVDDLCPTQSSYERNILESNVELLTRSFGEGNGKRRNNDYSDKSNVEQYVAEGGAVITGEYITGVESSLSRNLFLELRENDVDLNLLTTIQSDDTLLARFMYGLINYISGAQAQVLQFIYDRCREYRSHFQNIYSNGRYAEYYAQLQTASDLLMKYGEQTGQITANEAVIIRQRHTEAIQAVIEENNRKLVRLSPITQLCNAITTAIEGGIYPIVGRYDNPDNLKKTILFDDTYYYIPQPMIKDIKNSYDRDFGNGGIPNTTNYLGDLLADNGVIAVFNEGDGKRNAKAIAIGGKKVRYIHIFRRRLEELTSL